MSNFPSKAVFRTSELVADVAAIEQRRNCTFVGDFCIKGSGGVYSTDVAAIFWQENPPVEGYSNYFALISHGGQGFITSGQSVLDAPITALVTPDGEVVYSRHRWDCRQAKTAGFMIDGGRDYTRVVGDPGQSRWAQLVIQGPDILIEYQE